MALFAVVGLVDADAIDPDDARGPRGTEARQRIRQAAGDADAVAVALDGGEGGGDAPDIGYGLIRGRWGEGNLAQIGEEEAAGEPGMSGAWYDLEEPDGVGTGEWLI